SRPRAQEQTGRKPRCLAGIALRLVFVSKYRVEDMRAEAGLCRMARLAILITEQAVQPAVDLMPSGEIINDLDMAIAAIKLGVAEQIIHVNCRRVIALQIAELMLFHQFAMRVIDQRLDRQM